MPIGFGKQPDNRVYQGIRLVSERDDPYFSKVGQTIVQSTSSGTLVAEYNGSTPQGYLVSGRHIGENDGKAVINEDVRILTSRADITFVNKPLEDFLEKSQRNLDSMKRNLNQISNP